MGEGQEREQPVCNLKANKVDRLKESYQNSTRKNSIDEGQRKR